MAFNYFYGKQADLYGFVRVPKLLMTEKMFDPISIDAKLLYGLLIDRMSMAKKNDWIDEENRVYVLYPIAEIQEDMGVSKKKAIETVLIKGETILIASNLYPRELVKSKFLKLDFTHIEYAIGCFKSNTTKVNNIKKYLLATLFNAPSTIDGYFQAKVNHDFPQYASSRY